MNSNIEFDKTTDSNSEFFIFELKCPTDEEEDFECAGDEVLVESSPPASPDMAARLAAPAQSGAGGASPSTVRELIVIPELPESIHLQHAMQVSSTVVEVSGENSGQSSPSGEHQHTFITVANTKSQRHRSKGGGEGLYTKAKGSHITKERESTSDAVLLREARRVAWETSWAMEVPRYRSYYPCEGGNGVNYHVQYVTEPQEIYTQGHQMETLRSYPVYGVATVANGGGDADGAWGGASSADYTAYGVVVAGDEAEAPASPATPATGAPQPPRMPPATVQWLLDHYETAEGVSLPRSTLYAHYLRHCSTHHLEPVNAASFGKLIRSVFVGLRTRRLGTRGNSKYHYYGIRAKPNSDQPPDASDSADDSAQLSDKQESTGSRRNSVSSNGTRSPLGAASALHRQYLACVSAPEPPPMELPCGDLPPQALQLLRKHHREHGSMFLEAVAALDTGGVEAARRAFWRRCAAHEPLDRRALAKLCARKDVCAWLRTADTALYQRAVDMLLPDVLRPIPPQLTQAIRNFAKSVECSVSAGSTAAPAGGARAAARAAAALAGALRRYTSLNHLAQAARAVLTNQHQIHQMVSDLNRVDFRVVREQAGWACACPSPAVANKLEQDFKATLSRGATLEQWAAWLERCVEGALGSNNNNAGSSNARGDFVPRARRLLLDWSFYSSLVIRELTLRSAASFGSFHLLRLLYDEYVSYLVERRVAEYRSEPPIAVMHPPMDEEVEDNEEVLEEARPLDDERPLEDERPLDDEPDWDWEDEEEDDEPDNKRVKND